ncbi:hypothetical protein [Planobispora takensis]|uniref:Lipoprotein n=1 Tax=Planobispora takensis TaxID=1367882 RepID=A0A8J3TB13_9ACTN|nr:hypothetical protein [Planobispora takensis]GII04114.1 hypothetical protein Pta02_61220 [Planobispora takensis]
MRRWIATATTAAAAAIITPALIAPAHAASGPVPALKRQFTAGHGVKVQESVTERQVNAGGETFTSKNRMTGAYLFNASGVAASDLTYTDRYGSGAMRIITLPNASYTSSKDFPGTLPAGKTWLRWSGDGSMSPSVVNVLEPSTLKRLLTTTKKTRRGGKIDGASTTLRTGSITVGQLYAASPSLRARLGDRPRGATADLRISWKLWQDAKQRTRKLVSSYTESTQGLQGSWRTTITSSATFSGWGAKITIKAPPAASVLDFEDWQPGEEEPLAMLPEMSWPLPGRTR